MITALLDDLRHMFPRAEMVVTVRLAEGAPVTAQQVTISIAGHEYHGQSEVHHSFHCGSSSRAVRVVVLTTRASLLPP